MDANFRDQFAVASGEEGRPLKDTRTLKPPQRMTSFFLSRLAEKRRHVTGHVNKRSGEKYTSLLSSSAILSFLSEKNCALLSCSFFFSLRSNSASCATSEYSIIQQLEDPGDATATHRPLYHCLYISRSLSLPLLGHRERAENS